jgi:hypothetical protein
MTSKATTVRLNECLITLRPITPNDVAMEEEFVRQLSPETKHYRFFGAMKELSDAEAHRLCDVDGRLSMAFVATVRERHREVEIGVCRYAPSTDPEVREMAVTIADEWQHTQLPKLLLLRLIDAARETGIRELFAVELSDNRQMQDFAHEMGMTIKRDASDATQVIYSISI